MNLTNNWSRAAMDEFDFDYKDKAKLTQVNTFDISLEETDSKQDLLDQISVHLFDLLVNDEKNWKNGQRCRFCFKTTVELDEEEEYIECTTCKRIYRYHKRLETIPFPSQKYLFLAQAKLPYMIDTNTKYKLPFDFLKEARYDRLEQFNSYFDQVSTIMMKDERLEINSLAQEKNQGQELFCFFFPDFYEFMEKTEVLDSVKQGYTSFFWNDVNYKTFKEKTKKAKTLDKPDFLKDNNLFKQLKKDVQMKSGLTENFNKVPLQVFKELNKRFSSIVIKSHFDKEPFINLLYVFQLLQLSQEIPYISYFVEPLNKLKYKTYRSVPEDIIDKWKQANIHKKSLRIKLFFKNIYLTIKLYQNNDITITMPISKETKITRNTLVAIIEKVNMLIRKIQRLPYQQKLSNDTLQTLSNDIRSWGKDGSNMVFHALNMNNTIEFKEINMLAMVPILDCLKNYSILDIKEENKISFYYIFDVDDKQNVRYERFLREAFRRNLSRFTRDTIENLQLIEEIKKEFGIFFNLEENHLNLLFNKWIDQNQAALENIKDGGSKKLRWSMINGIYVTLEYLSNEFYRFKIHGIKYWHQEEDIINFTRRIFHLVDNLDKYPFFQEVCSASKKGSVKKQKIKTNLNQALKRHFPKLFWDAQINTKGEKGYARKCQKKETPLIFTDDEAYRNWLKKQEPKNKTDLQKTFTRGCPTLELNEMKAKLKELGYKPVSSNRNEVCLQLQKALFANKDKRDIQGNVWSIDELKSIMESLHLPVISSRTKLITQLERYFNIQDMIIKENINDVMPNPQTLILKKDDKNFYITCPNDLKNPKSQSSKFLGFLDVDAHPLATSTANDKKKKWCVPCCRERINETRTDFCRGLIDYEDYVSGTSTQGSIDYIKNDTKFPLAPNRYGHLHHLIFQLLNQHPHKEHKLMKKVNRLPLIRRFLYLRKGIVQTNFSFLTAVGVALNASGAFNLKKTLKILKNTITEDLFRSLNSGNLYWTYNGNLNNYKAIFNSDNLEAIDIHDMWDIISRPNILSPLGLNIIVFEVRDNKLHLMCPMDQEIQHFFSERKPTVLLFKEGDQYEPIITYIDQETQVGTPAFTPENLRALAAWYKDTCTLVGLQPDLTAKSMIKKFKVDKQLVDKFNKVQYLIVDGFPLPTVPSGLSLEVPRGESNNVKRYMKTFKATMEFLKQNNIEPSGVNVKNGYIKEIVVNDRLMPVILEPYKEQLPIEDGILDLSAVDEAILMDLPKQSFQKQNMSKFRQEAYQRFRMEFSHFNKGKANNFEETLKKFIKELMIIDSKDLKVYEQQNVRNLCAKAEDDSHCMNEKLIILAKDVEPFSKKLLDELERFPLKRREILEKRIDVLIDPLLFLNDQKHIFS